MPLPGVVELKKGRAVVLVDDIDQFLQSGDELVVVDQVFVRDVYAPFISDGRRFDNDASGAPFCPRLIDKLSLFTDIAVRVVEELRSRGRLVYSVLEVQAPDPDGGKEFVKGSARFFLPLSNGSRENR